MSGDSAFWAAWYLLRRRPDAEVDPDRLPPPEDVFKPWDPFLVTVVLILMGVPAGLLLLVWWL